MEERSPMSGGHDLSFAAVCTDSELAAPHNLGPTFKNEAIARLWLSNYLTYTAESLELDGDTEGHAAAYRDAAPCVRRHGHATVGHIHYKVQTKDAGLKAPLPYGRVNGRAPSST